MYEEEPEESVLFDKHLEPKENPSLHNHWSFKPHVLYWNANVCYGSDLMECMKMNAKASAR